MFRTRQTKSGRDSRREHTTAGLGAGLFLALNAAATALCTKLSGVELVAEGFSGGQVADAEGVVRRHLDELVFADADSADRNLTANARADRAEGIRGVLVCT